MWDRTRCSPLPSLSQYASSLSNFPLALSRSGTEQGCWAPLAHAGLLAYNWTAVWGLQHVSKGICHSICLPSTK